MTLSDAILKGAEQRPQAFGRFFPLGPDGITRSCAIGAAYEGLFGTTDCEESYITAVMDTYPWLRSAGDVSCPVAWCARALPLTALGAVGHLNDAHQWTREQIAAWLEPIEEAWSSR